MCNYFARCTSEPEGTVKNPVIGDVLTCQRCADLMDQILVPLSLFDAEMMESLADDEALAHDTCRTCLTAITELDGIWYHDHGDGHGLAQHLARPSGVRS